MDNPIKQLFGGMEQLYNQAEQLFDRIKQVGDRLPLNYFGEIKVLRTQLSLSLASANLRFSV